MNNRAHVVSLCSWLWLGMSCSMVSACPVRVYEAAFGRWVPDEYSITVDYAGDLANAPAKAINALKAQSEDNIERANVRAEFRKAEGRDPKAPPLMRVTYLKKPPRMVGMPEDLSAGVLTSNVVWSGPLTDEATARILDSPVRKEIKKRLIEGEVAVWLLLESGDKPKDDEAARRVQAMLNDIQANMKAPPIPPVPSYSLAVPAAPVEDVTIVLSLIRLSRSNPEEQFLAATIQQSLGDLKGAKEPLLVPVFGRGMMLSPFYGEQISPESIQKVVGALLQQCSCTCPLPHYARFLLMRGGWAQNAEPQ